MHLASGTHIQFLLLPLTSTLYCLYVLLNDFLTSASIFFFKNLIMFSKCNLIFLNKCITSYAGSLSLLDDPTLLTGRVLYPRRTIYVQGPVSATRRTRNSVISVHVHSSLARFSRHAQGAAQKSQTSGTEQKRKGKACMNTGHKFLERTQAGRYSVAPSSAPRIRASRSAERAEGWSSFQARKEPCLHLPSTLLSFPAHPQSKLGAQKLHRMSSTGQTSRVPGATSPRGERLRIWETTEGGGGLRGEASPSPPDAI